MTRTQRLADYKVPFDFDGNLLLSPAGRSDVEWREVVVFDAGMRLVGLGRSRSNAHFILADADGCEYPVMTMDMAELLQHCDCVDGQIVGDVRWVTVKRGRGFGVRVVLREGS
jgi:hypothetical protein